LDGFRDHRSCSVHIYVRYESAIADLIAPRMAELEPQDPRRTRGAGNGYRPHRAGRLAVSRLGSLPDRVHQGLAAIAVS
jgi:hypothetical protein